MGYALKAVNGGHVRIPKPSRGGYEFRFKIYIDDLDIQNILFSTIGTSDANRFWFRYQPTQRRLRIFYRVDNVSMATYFVPLDNLIEGINDIRFAIHFTNETPVKVSVNGVSAPKHNMTPGTGSFDPWWDDITGFGIFSAHYGSGINTSNNPNNVLHSFSIERWSHSTDSYPGTYADYDLDATGGVGTIIPDKLLGPPLELYFYPLDNNDHWVSTGLEVTPTPLVSTASTSIPLLSQDKTVEPDYWENPSILRNPIVSRQLTIEPPLIPSVMSVEQLRVVKDKLIRMLVTSKDTKVYDGQISKDILILAERIDNLSNMSNPEVIGGYRPLPDVPMITDEGYGLHKVSATELYVIIKELSKRVAILERK